MDPDLVGYRGYPTCTSCQDAGNGWKNTECFEYRTGQFQSGSRSFFGGFLVQQPKEALDQKACVSPQPGEEKQAKTKVIHDLTFTVFHAEKSLEGREEQWEIYRTYHSGTCYALVVRKGWTGAASSGSKGEKKFDEQTYHAFEKDLAEPVNTFEFLK